MSRLFHRPMLSLRPPRTRSSERIGIRGSIRRSVGRVEAIPVEQKEHVVELARQLLANQPSISRSRLFQLVSRAVNSRMGPLSPVIGEPAIQKTLLEASIRLPPAKKKTR